MKKLMLVVIALVFGTMANAQTVSTENKPEVDERPAWMKASLEKSKKELEKSEAELEADLKELEAKRNELSDTQKVTAMYQDLNRQIAELNALLEKKRKSKVKSY